MASGQKRLRFSVDAPLRGKLERVRGERRVSVRGGQAAGGEEV